jgi:hypothetical protein
MPRTHRASLPRRAVRTTVGGTVVLGILLLWVPTVGAAENGSSRPQLSGSNFSLDGVACPGTSTCLAVGSYNNDSGGVLPLSLRWNGKSWITVKTPGSDFSELADVSCPDTSNCMAVGTSRYGTLAENWNGTAWTIVPSPAPTGANSSDLVSVSCPTSTSCAAVGSFVNSSGATRTLAEQWNGSAWRLVPSPNRSGTTGSELEGVSCPSASSCVSVGDSFNKVGNSQTLAESWNGATWSLVPSPNPAKGQENTLSSASCISTTNCTAAGDYWALPGETVVLIEAWNGTKWSLVAGAGASGFLNGVSCSAFSECMAVGDSVPGTLAEQQNGPGWSVLPSPNPRGMSASSLSGVSCASPSSCNAVGYSIGSGSDTTYNLAETWNGQHWTLARVENS